MSGDGAGAGGGERAEWQRIYDRVEAQVEVLVAGRAPLEALNKIQHEFWSSRDRIKEARLHEMELSKFRWEATCKDLLSGDDPKLTELLKSDLEDSRTYAARFHIENYTLEIQLNEVRGCVELNENPADNENTARDIRAHLRKLKQAYESMSANKDKEVSALLVEKELLRNQLREVEKDKATLLKIKEVEGAQANEAIHKLQKDVEELQAAARNKEELIGSLRVVEKESAALLKMKQVEGAQANEAIHKLRKDVEELQGPAKNKDEMIGRLRAEALGAKNRLLVPGSRLEKMQSLPKEKSTRKLKDQQLETRKRKCASLPNMNVKSQCHPIHIAKMADNFNVDQKLIVRDDLGCESMLHMKRRKLDPALSRELLWRVNTTDKTLHLGDEFIPIIPYVPKITGLPNGPIEIKAVDDVSCYVGDELFDELPDSACGYLAVNLETDKHKFSVKCILGFIALYAAPSTKPSNKDHKRYFGSISKCKDMKELNLCGLAAKSLFDGIDTYIAGTVDTCPGCMDILHVMAIDFASTHVLPRGLPRNNFLTSRDFDLLYSMKCAILDEQPKDVKDTAYYDETDDTDRSSIEHHEYPGRGTGTCMNRLAVGCPSAPWVSLC